MRYSCLINKTPSGIHANSRKEVDNWVNEQLQTRDLDWRVGYLIKFRDSKDLYQWIVNKTQKELYPT